MPDPEIRDEHLPEQIPFHYIKTSDYRPIFVDGVIGGLNGKGMITMGVFSEHVALPQRIVHSVTSEGKLGSEILDERISREGAVRDLSALLIFDKSTAKSMIEWLEGQIHQLDELRLNTEKSRNG